MSAHSDDKPPPRKRNPVGSFDESIRDPLPFYGTRLGTGCWWRFGSEDDHRRPGRINEDAAGPSVTQGSANRESVDDARYWRRRRVCDEFTVKAPEVARTAFLNTARLLGVHPREAGQDDPPESHRYRVVGAAKLLDADIVIDLGFWVGPLVILNGACDAAALAIIRRWSLHTETIFRYTGGDIPTAIATVNFPQAQAGFSWGVVQ